MTLIEALAAHAAPVLDTLPYLVVVAHTLSCQPGSCGMKTHLELRTVHLSNRRICHQIVLANLAGCMHLLVDKATAAYCVSQAWLVKVVVVLALVR